MVTTHLKESNTEQEMKLGISVKMAFILQPKEIQQDALVQAGYLLLDVAVSCISVLT